MGMQSVIAEQLSKLEANSRMLLGKDEKIDKLEENIHFQ
jgi:hypothetical protein